MPRLDGTGPDKSGKQTGRGLGRCNNLEKDDAIDKLGKGKGMRRKSGGGQGQGKRFKSGIK